MTASAALHWWPVARSEELRAAENIIAAFHQGQELAVWRSFSGRIQVWENRCPHRSVRLTSGFIRDGRLNCAYHGWQFNADTGACVRVPAHPSEAAPAPVQVRRFVACEFDGLVWINPEQSLTPDAEVADIAGKMPPRQGVSHFLRTMSIRASMETVSQALVESGWQSSGNGVLWLGRLAERGGWVYLNPSHESRCELRVWLTPADSGGGSTASRRVLAELRSMRQLIESRQADRAATRTPLPAEGLGSSPFSSADPALLNDWLTLGPASALAGRDKSSPKRTRLLGESVELWVNAQGMPQCRLPAHPQVILQPVEHYGYLWVCPSGQPARPIFAMPEVAEPGRRIVDCAGFGVATSGLRVVENFLDMAHFPYVHTGYLGAEPRTEVLDYQVEVDDRSDEIWATECRFWQPRASAVAHDGVLATYRYRVMNPYCAALYKTCVARDDAMDAIGLFVQPLDQEHSIAYVLLAYFDEDSRDIDLIAFQQLIFGQDKPILENHQLRRMPLTGGVESPTRADRTSFVYRRWLKARGQRYGTHDEAATA